MNFDWRGRVILAKLAEGCTLRESAEVAGISRQAVLKRVNASPDFAQAAPISNQCAAIERKRRVTHGDNPRRF
jgi:hypothetical protein